MKLSKQVSNLEKVTDIAIKFCVEMPKKWLFGDYHTKQQLQQLLFPTGLSYEKKTDECRTTRINSVFLYIAYFQQIISNKKSGIPELNLNYAAFADLVAQCERFTNQFVEDLRLLANINKFNDGS